MIRFFKFPQPATFLVIPIIVLILWGQSAFHIPVASDDTSMPLWTLIADFITALPPFVRFLIMVCIISLEAIYFNRLADRHEVLYHNSYFPALCFALTASCSSSMLVVHPVHFSNLLLLRVIDKLFSLFKNEKPTAALFDSGFLLAVSGLIYFPSIPFFLLLLVALNLMRPFNWKEMWILFAGFILPCFYISVYYFITGGFNDFWLSVFSKFRGWPHWSTAGSPALFALAGFLALLLLLSLQKLRRNYYKNVIRTRTFQLIMFIFLIISAAAMLLLKTILPIHLVLAAIPVSLFYAYYFLSARKKIWMYESLLWLFIGIIIWNHL